MIYDITNLEQSPHFSPEDRPLYWLNKEHTILTDGYKLFDYSKERGVVERQYAEIPSNHHRINYELIETIVKSVTSESSYNDLVNFFKSNNFTEDDAKMWADLFIDAVSEFTLQENSFDNFKNWIQKQLQNKSVEKVTEMLIGMLAFTDVFQNVNIVVYKNDIPYKQIVIV